MKLGHYLLVLFLSMLASCSSTIEKDECFYPGTDEDAPGWICDEPLDKLEVQAVGVAKPSESGFSFMKDMAIVDGRARVAEQIKITVSKMVKKHLTKTGVGDDEVIDAVSSSTIKTLSSETIRGSKVYKSKVGPEGRYYVLVGLTSESLRKSAKKALSSSMLNNQALWQKLVAKESFNELKEAIANTK